MTTPIRQSFLAVPDGASLFFQVQGAGEPAAVLCDGLGCDGFAWKYLTPYLEKSHRTVRWHYRGHGQSTLPDDRSRIGVIHTCEDLEQIMDAAGLEQAVLFGHSMGVQVALEFHRRNPRRVLGMVLICGSYGTPLDTFHDSNLLKKALPFIRRTVERFPRPIAQIVRTLLSTELAVQMAISLELNRALITKSDLVPYFTHLANMDPVVFVRTLDSLASHSALDHLPHVDVPTLVIGGGKDKFTPVWLSEKMAKSIPDSEYLLVPQGTHTATLEQPELIELRIENFLNQHFRKAKPRKKRAKRAP